MSDLVGVLIGLGIATICVVVSWVIAWWGWNGDDVR